MTRPTGNKRTTTRSSQTSTGAAGSQQQSRAGSSLRRRSPVTYWVAIVGVIAMVLTTAASLVSVFL